MTSIDNLNFRKHLCMQKGPEMVELAKPLQKYGITHFGFSKIHRDQHTEVLITHPGISEVFHNMKGYEHAFCGDIDSYVDCVALWQDINNGSEFATEYVSTMSESFNVDHGLVITKKFTDYVEFYYFATTRDNDKIYSFYLNNIDLFEAFIQYFNDCGNDLLDRSFQQRFYVPNGNDETLLLSDKFQKLCNVRPAVRQTKRMAAVFDFYHLSKRERQCVLRLITGATCKEIANKLKISPRTIEKYILNIKKRTKSKTLYQALCKLIQ